MLRTPADPFQPTFGVGGTPIFFAPDEPVADAPAPEAPEAPVPEAPEAPQPGTPEAGTPDPENPEAPPAEEPEPVDWAKRVTDEWGGEDRVKQAIALEQALQTPDGVKALFEEAARYLGVGNDKIADILGVPAPEPEGGDPVVDLLVEKLDLDATSAAELAKALRGTAEEAVAPLQQERKQEREQARASNVDAAITAVLPEELHEDENVRKLVCGFADRYITDEALLDDPAAVKDALRRGHADMQAAQEKAQKAYLEGKKKVKDETPTPLSSGSTPGGEEIPEPQNVKEAGARLRARLGL